MCYNETRWQNFFPAPSSSEYRWDSVSKHLSCPILIENYKQVGWVITQHQEIVGIEEYLLITQHQL